MSGTYKIPQPQNDNTTYTYTHIEQASDRESRQHISLTMSDVELSLS